MTLVGILEKLAPEPFFPHALSGCDTTQAVSGKRKLSFYHTWFIKSYSNFWKE